MHIECALCKVSLTSNRSLVEHLSLGHQLLPSEYFAHHPTANKFCSKCRQPLPITDFFVDQTNNYGYRAQCVNCMRPQAGKRRCPLCSRLFSWSSIVTHFKTDHGIPPLVAYHEHLKEKQCSKCNQVKSLDAFSRLQDEDKVYFSWCRACNTTRAVERAARDSEFSVAQRVLVRLAFGDRCFVCGMTHDESVKVYGEPLEVDHIIAHSLGGALSVGTALLLCGPCNLSKGTQGLEAFLLQRLADREAAQDAMKRLAGIQEWATTEARRLLAGHVYQKYLSSRESASNDDD